MFEYKLGKLFSDQHFFRFGNNRVKRIISYSIKKSTKRAIMSDKKDG